MNHGRPARVVRRSERFFRYECGVRGRTVPQNESGGAAALRCGSPCKNLSLCLRPAVPLFGYLHVPNEYDEAIKWSPASQLPEYAIRRKAIVTKFEYKPLRSFTADDIKLLRLDYASQDDPQLLMEEYLPIKNFELLYGWWKQHYKATLKDCDNPQAIILHLASTD